MNPQPPVLETGALPVELLSYCFRFKTYFPIYTYFVSLNMTCFLITGSYFLYSTLSGCNFLLFVNVYLNPVPAVLSNCMIFLLLFPAIIIITLQSQLPHQHQPYDHLHESQNAILYPSLSKLLMTLQIQHYPQA